MEFNNAGYDIFSEAGVNPALCLSNRDTSERMRRGDDPPAGHWGVSVSAVLSDRAYRAATTGQI